MIIYYEPTNKQVRAMFTGDTSSTVWSGLGYIKATVPANLESQVSMDKAVVLDGDVITGFIDWPRPVMSADKTSITADGVDEAAITATGVENDESVMFSVNETETVVVASGNTAGIEFSSEIAGIYSISCFSPKYGRSFIQIEVIDE